MLSQAIGDLLPAAAAVALSPIPIVAVVLVLDSPRARVNGPAFAAGWVAGLAARERARGDPRRRAPTIPGAMSSTGVDWVTAGHRRRCSSSMAAQQWKKRPRPGQPAVMPSWMATISSVSPGKAALLGLALSGANPKNVALTLAASAAIAQAGLDRADTALAVAVFVVIGSLTVVGAVVCSLVAPRRSERPLASIRAVHGRQQRDDHDGRVAPARAPSSSATASPVSGADATA